MLSIVWYTARDMATQELWGGVHKRLVGVGLVGGAALVALLPSWAVVPCTALIALIAVYVGNSYEMFLALVALFPFIGITISLGSFDAPIADWIALPLMVIYGYLMLRKERVQALHHHIKDHLPGIMVYGVFLLIAGITVLRVPPEMSSASLGYFLRFVLFTYIAYVALPFWVVNTKERMETVIKIMFWTGLGIAIYGLISLGVNPAFWGVWRRVSPFAIGGIFPVGPNHNQLAEIMVYTAPFGWLLSRGHEGQAKKWYVVATGVIIAAGVLTFARTAWIAVGLQGLLAIRLLKPRALVERVLEWWPLLIGVAGITLYMVIFSSSALVASSTATRLDLTRIAILQMSKTPFMGKGIGTFIPSLTGVYSFRFDYGEPIEAHGLLQKLSFETGLFGLTAMLGFFAWLFSGMIRHYRTLAEGQYRDTVLAALLAVFGTFTYQLFNTSYFGPKLWFLVGFACIVWFGQWKFSRV